MVVVIDIDCVLILVVLCIFFVIVNVCWNSWFR